MEWVKERSIEFRHLIVTKLPVGFDHSSSKVHKIEHLLHKIDFKIGLYSLTAGMQPQRKNAKCLNKKSKKLNDSWSSDLGRKAQTKQNEIPERFWQERI